MKNKDNREINQKGYIVFPYLQVFDETFQRDASSIFSSFFSEFSQAKDWMLYSDYCIGDKNKNSDVITFTFAPYAHGFIEYEELVEKYSFKDIKHLKKVNIEFLHLIKNSPVLSISIMLNKDRKIYYDEKEKDSLLQAFDGIHEMIDYWKKNEPESPEKYKSAAQDIIFIRRELKNNKINIKLMRDIYITASIAAYLMFEVNKTIPVGIMGWFSDRDSLLSYKSAQLEKPIIFRLTHIMYHILCEKKQIPSNGNPIFFIPEEKGKVSYDAMLRIPDIICATLADYNFSTKEFSHEKYYPILENLFKSNKKIIVIDLKLTKNSNTATIIEF